MEAILKAVTDVFTSGVGMVSTVGTTITEQPILLLFCIIPLCGLGIGYFKRLISVN